VTHSSSPPARTNSAPHSVLSVCPEEVFDTLQFGKVGDDVGGELQTEMPASGDRIRIESRASPHRYPINVIILLQYHHPPRSHPRPLFLFPSMSNSTPSSINRNDKRAQELREKAGRFRILIIGRANSGKTTILQKICKTNEKPEIFNSKGEKVCCMCPYNVVYLDVF
jgi:hypothetical protein